MCLSHNDDSTHTHQRRVQNQTNNAPVIYTRVIVDGLENGRNQSNLNLHILQM